MQPVGSALIKPAFTATKIWPSPQFTLDGWVDLEKEYKQALSGKMVTVMEISKDEAGYLVLGYTAPDNPFIWQIEKDDVAGYIPLIKKNGQIIPGGMSAFEEFMWNIKNNNISNTEQYTKQQS